MARDPIDVEFSIFAGLDKQPVFKIYGLTDEHDIALTWEQALDLRQKLSQALELQGGMIYGKDKTT